MTVMAMVSKIRLLRCLPLPKEGSLSASSCRDRDQRKTLPRGTEECYDPTDCHGVAMKVSCPNCSAQQDLDIDPKAGAARASCGECGTSFLVRVRARVRAQGEGGQVYNWYVRKEDGTLLSFPGDTQLHAAIQKGLVDLTDQIAADGKNWSTISSLPILKAFMERWGGQEGKKAGEVAPEGPPGSLVANAAHGATPTASPNVTSTPAQGTAAPAGRRRRGVPDLPEGGTVGIHDALRKPSQEDRPASITESETVIGLPAVNGLPGGKDAMEEPTRAFELEMEAPGAKATPETVLDKPRRRSTDRELKAEPVAVSAVAERGGAAATVSERPGPVAASGGKKGRDEYADPDLEWEVEWNREPPRDALTGVVRYVRRPYRRAMLAALVVVAGILGYLGGKMILGSAGGDNVRSAKQTEPVASPATPKGLATPDVSAARSLDTLSEADLIAGGGDAVAVDVGSPGDIASGGVAAWDVAGAGGGRETAGDVVPQSLQSDAGSKGLDVSRPAPRPSDVDAVAEADTAEAQGTGNGGPEEGGTRGPSSQGGKEVEVLKLRTGDLAGKEEPPKSAEKASGEEPQARREEEPRREKDATRERGNETKRDRDAKRDRETRRDREEPTENIRGVEGLVDKADQLRQKGRYNEAYELYRKAAGAKPRDPSIHYKMGECRRKQGKLEEAKGHYQEAINLTGYVPAYMGLARLYQTSGDRGKALETVRQGLEKYPNHRLLQSLYSELGGE